MSDSQQCPSPAPLLIDTHVHFHSCFDRDAFLDAAARNFARGAAELGIAGPFMGCLMLAETAEDALVPALAAAGGRREARRLGLRADARSRAP